MNDSEKQKVFLGVGAQHPKLIEALSSDLESVKANLVLAGDEMQVRRLQGQAQYLVKLLARMGHKSE